MLDPDSRSRKENPYARNNPFDGGGHNYVTMGENDAVGGGNTHQPATLDSDIHTDPRSNTNYGLIQKNLPVDTTLLDNEESGVVGPNHTGKNRPYTDGWKGFVDQGSPLNPINQNSRDVNTFQSKLNNNSLMFGRNFSDIIRNIRKRFK